MCKECYGNEVIYEFYVNHKTKEVTSDWVYCPTCYPNSQGFFQCPWMSNYKIIDITKYYEYIENGYKALDS